MRDPHSEFLRYHFGDQVTETSLSQNETQQLKNDIEELKIKVDNQTNLILALLQEIRKLNTL